MADNNVTIFVTPNCPYCEAAKKYLTEKGIAFTERDAAADIEAVKYMVEKSGQTGVPVFEKDGEIVVGFNREDLDELLGISN